MSDLIDRQVAISAICSACGKIDCDKMDKCEKLQLPPANNSEIPNSSDTISRQAAIKACGGYLVPANIIRELPPVQPEIVPCDYVKACKEATRNSPIDVYVYRNALAELKELGYVLVEMREPLNAKVATDINVGDKDTERKKAQWRAVRINPRMICCSNCNSGWWYKELIKALKFCPNCGADMREVTDHG